MRVWRVKHHKELAMRQAVFLSLELARDYAQRVCEQSRQKVTVYEEVTTFVPQVRAREAANEAA